MTASSHQLSVRSSTDEAHHTVLSLDGEVDLETAPGLRDQILEAAADGATVVVDLRGVGFMDSPGLGILIYCHRQLSHQHSTLVIRSPRGHVRELFDMVRLSSELNVED